MHMASRSTQKQKPSLLPFHNPFVLEMYLQIVGTQQIVIKWKILTA